MNTANSMLNEKSYSYRLQRMVLLRCLWAGLTGLAVVLPTQAAWVGTYDTESKTGTLSDGNWMLKIEQSATYIKKADGTYPAGSNGRYYITGATEGSGVLDLRHVGEEADPEGNKPMYHPNAIVGFKSFSNVTGVYLNDECIEMQNDAFKSASALRFFVSGVNLERLGQNALASCSSLTGVVFRSNITTIGFAGFQNSALLKTITPFAFPSLSSIGTGAFTGTTSLSGDLKLSCPLLKKVTGSVNSNGAFMNSGISSVDFTGSGVEQVNPSAFQGCTSLTNVVFPAGIQSIGENAFYNDNKLQRVDMGGSTNYLTIGVNAFNFCSKMGEVVLSPFVTNFSQAAFSRCDKLTNVVVQVPQDAKRWCEMMKNVKGGLGKNAFFANSKLENLDLPWGGGTIWATNALAGVTSLRELRFFGEPPTLEPCQDVFGMAYSGGAPIANPPPAYQLKILCPKGSRNSWRTQFCTGAVTTQEKARVDYPGDHTIGTFASPNKEWVVWEKTPFDVTLGLCLIVR